MVVFPFLPEGTYARSFANLFFSLVAYFHRESGNEVLLSNEGIEFRGELEDVCTSMSATAQAIVEVVEARGVKGIKMHKNDRSVLSKVLERLGVKAGFEDYVSAFVLMLKAFSKGLESDAKEEIISDLTLSIRRKDTIEYGKDVQAPLQSFKLEKYEYGKDFLDLRRVKGDLKLSPYWMAIISGGWLLSYMGLKGGYLVFSLPPDDLLELSLYSQQGMYTFLSSYGVNDPLAAYGENGILSSPARVRGSNVLPSAYQILLALENASVNVGPEGFALRIVRVYFDGKRFTVVEDSTMRISRLLFFARNLVVDKDATRAVRSLAECAIMGYQGRLSNWCERNFGDVGSLVKMVNFLYRAAIGSEQPERAVYQIARLSPEAKTDTIPFFRKGRILEHLYRSLKEMGIE